MQFQEIKSKLDGITYDTLRIDCDNHFEAVILKEELNKLTRRLEGFFGSPVWPSKNRLPFQIRQTIESFGGILSGQTLYFCQQGRETVFAMLWPWEDGKRTTVKIIKKI